MEPVDLGKVILTLQSLLNTLSKHASIIDQAVGDAANEGYYTTMTKTSAIEELSDGMVSLIGLMQNIEELLSKSHSKARAEEILNNAEAAK